MKWFIGLLRRYEKKDWRFPPYRWQMGCSMYLKYLIFMREMGKINICFTYACKCIRQCFLVSVHGMQVMQVIQCYYRELQLFTSQLDSSIFHYNSRNMYVYGRMSRPQLQRIIKHTASHRNPFSNPSKCQPSAQETPPASKLPNTGCASRRDTRHHHTWHSLRTRPGSQQANEDTDYSDPTWASCHHYQTCCLFIRFSLHCYPLTKWIHRSLVDPPRMPPVKSVVLLIGWGTHCQEFNNFWTLIKYDTSGVSTVLGNSLYLPLTDPLGSSISLPEIHFDLTQCRWTFSCRFGVFRGADRGAF